METDGDFIVSWTSVNQDGSSDGIYLQRYNASGVAQGSELLVNSTTNGSQTNSAITVDADGDFIIAWQDNSSGFSEIRTQRYTANGTPVGGESNASRIPVGSRGNAKIASDTAGNTVVVWQSANQDGSGYGIYAQRYSAAGIAQGNEFRVNTTTAGNQKLPDVAMDLDGDFVVTWQSANQDGSGYGIYAQRFNPAGVAQGSEFLVNTTTASDQRFSTVAIDAEGDFIITWTSHDVSSEGIYAQRFNANGVTQGGEFLVNTFTVNGQTFSQIAAAADGSFVIIWQGYGDDPSGQGV